MKRYFAVLFLVCFFPAFCLAGDFSGYSAVTLERRNYDPYNYAELDGIVFFPGEMKYLYIRRLDDDYRLRLNTAEGIPAAPVKPGENAKYETLIRENKLYLHEIKDKSGKPVMIVYCSLRTKVTWSRDKDGSIFLEVRDPFKKEEWETIEQLFPRR